MITEGIKSMELREIISFYHVARLKSFTKAAEHLGIRQTTVSGHIQRLEADLNTVLLDRNTNAPISITTHGQELLDIIKPMMPVLEQLELLKT